MPATKHLPRHLRSRSELLKVRCSAGFKSAVISTAMAEEKDLSELVRSAIGEYLARRQRASLIAVHG